MITPRANWAATVPWDGITGKPDFIGGASDIGDLTGDGFANRQVPVWSVSLRKFIPANISGIAGYSNPSPAPDTTVGFTDYFIEWDVPSLAPLQSAYEDFPAIGAAVNQPVLLSPTADVTFFNWLAFVKTNDTIRLQVTNMNLTTEDLANSLWRVRLFDL